MTDFWMIANMQAEQLKKIKHPEAKKRQESLPLRTILFALRGK